MICDRVTIRVGLEVRWSSDCLSNSFRQHLVGATCKPYFFSQHVVDTLKTTLGPRGMDKLIHLGRDTTISNDGATIMKLLEVEHPAAKALVDIAQSQVAMKPCRCDNTPPPITSVCYPRGGSLDSLLWRSLNTRFRMLPFDTHLPVNVFQDNEVGDGTTSVVLLAGEFLRNAKDLLEDGVAPQVIIKAYRQACNLVCLHKGAISPAVASTRLTCHVATGAMIGTGATVIQFQTCGGKAEKTLC